MATKKITELNELETANDNDLLVIVDVANNETKKIKAVNIGTGGGVDIPQQDTAPEDPVEDDLWIDTDDNTNLVGVVSSTTVSDKDTYSCNYLNQHLYDMYSENEVLTNKIWIDGRPIYRTVIDKGGIAVPAGFATLFAHGIANIKQITSCEFLMINEQNGYCVKGTFADGDGYKIFWADNTNVSCGGTTYMSASSSNHRIFILEYTKTTDSGDR